MYFFAEVIFCKSPSFVASFCVISDCIIREDSFYIL